MSKKSTEAEVTYVENNWGDYVYDPKLSFNDNVNQAKMQEAVITYEKLMNIEAGITTVEKQEGPRGLRGYKGDIPKHKWEGTTQVRFENPDGTWGDLVDLNPQAIQLKQEKFITAEEQDTFTLTKGTYSEKTNSISWYLEGIKQPNEALEVITPTEIKIRGGVPKGSTVILEYVEFANVALGLKGEVGETGPAPRHKLEANGDLVFELPEGGWGEPIRLIVSNSQLENDMNYQTREEVLTTVHDVGRLKKEVVEELPEVVNASSNTMYLIRNEQDTGFKEYMVIEDAWEILGDTAAVDFTGYVQDKDLNEISIAEIDALWQ